jgi:hypothetical protein
VSLWWGRGIKGEAMVVQGRNVWEILVPSSLFCYETETLLEIIK